MLAVFTFSPLRAKERKRVDPMLFQDLRTFLVSSLIKEMYFSDWQRHQSGLAPSSPLNRDTGALNENYRRIQVEALISWHSQICATWVRKAILHEVSFSLMLQSHLLNDTFAYYQPEADAIKLSVLWFSVVSNSHHCLSQDIAHSMWSADIAWFDVN